MMADNNNSTQTDDNIVDSSTEDQMLADILNKSEILQEAGVVPREESQPEPELEYSEDIGTEEDLEDPVESAEYEDDVEPDNEEVLLMLMKIALKKSNYSKVKDLSQTFVKVCNKLCDENNQIQDSLKNIEPKNES